MKFLGVTIDEHLEWDLQVKNVIKRMIAGNYSLAMIKNMLPVESKLLIYYSNVKSHATYGISAWGPLITKKLLKSIRVQQNKSIRLIFCAGTRANLRVLYKKGKILTIEDIINLELLKISHRHIHDKLPVRLTNLFDVTRHNYNTRNRRNLRASHHTTLQYNKSFLGASPHLWLQLTDNLKAKPKLKSFVKSYSKQVYQSYL